MIVLDSSPKDQTSQALTRLSLVIPCYNEESGLDQLAERLKIVRSAFAEQLDLEVVFVDDGSKDETFAGLERRFQHLTWAKVVRHPANAGIAAAIMTGIRAATHDLVATMDADCTYDPMQLIALVERMTPEVAMVTASPYHPDGKVDGIPSWRLLLSRTASCLYSWLLSAKIHTYTSCFRLHRRSFMMEIPLREGGFVGVAEMLWHVRRNGGRIEEVPARLTTRRIGVSKMKTIPVILSHLKLMSRIATDRVFQARTYS